MFLATQGLAKNLDHEIDSLNKHIDNKELYSRVNSLIRIADDYRFKEMYKKRDSLYDLAIQSTILYDSISYTVLNKYFSHVDFFLDALSPELSVEYSKKMLSIANGANNSKWLFEAYRSLAITSIINRKPEDALNYINKAYYHVTLINNEKLKTECIIYLGYCQEKNNKKVEAFRSYMDALYLSEKNNDAKTKINVFDRLSEFYLHLNKYEKAKNYKTEEIKYYLAQQPIDSEILMGLQQDLVQILFHSNENNQAEDLAINIIAYSKKNGYDLYKNEVFRLYRTYLIENSLFNGLSDLYVNKYPDEYRQLATEDTTLYYRINGYILEANGKSDSAHIFYKLAEDRLLQRGRGGISHANFYKRYGEFLLRQNNIGEAIQKFDSAYKYALAANYFPYLVESTHYLDSLSYMEGNMKEAYHYAGLNKMYSDKQAAINKGEEMLQLEVENEARQQELKVEMAKKETERRYNLQYTAMVISIIGIFILLATLGTFKVHPTYIRILGFFSFIFFFEFIIMIADHQIHDFTHGEPWKFMAFKIVLIAILLPLHHWLEEKVIHYLVHHHMMSAPKMTMKIPGFGRKKSEAVVEEKPSDN